MDLLRVKAFALHDHDEGYADSDGDSRKDTSLQESSAVSSASLIYSAAVADGVPVMSKQPAMKTEVLAHAMPSLAKQHRSGSSIRRTFGI